MKHEFTHELETAAAVARDAAELIRLHGGRVNANAVSEKGRHDLVTEIDVASQELIVSSLRRHFPDYGFLAEEEQDDEGPPNASRRWVIDPIDGTTNFTHGVPPYSVSIGLIEDETVMAAVVLEVVSGETFTAIRGAGSYVNGVPMRVSDARSLDEALISTGFPYRSVGHVDQYLAVLREFMVRCRGVRRHGSAAIDLAYLAAGRFDGFFETGLMAWDIAAGMLLIEEAGGRVTTFEGGSSVLFDGQILASNGGLHDEMREVLQPLVGVFS
ncbi:MAG: inositol monophosphatase [Rhodothermales bacterium]|nr:inositol monophosphatase [Rhodothermales bacterium]